MKADRHLIDLAPSNQNADKIARALDDVAARTARLAEQAEGMAPGPERAQVEARIRELKPAVQMSEWLRPPVSPSDRH
jgi:hypothetical protein